MTQHEGIAAMTGFRIYLAPRHVGAARRTAGARSNQIPC